MIFLAMTLQGSTWRCSIITFCAFERPLSRVTSLMNDEWVLVKCTVRALRTVVFHWKIELKLNHKTRLNNGTKLTQIRRVIIMLTSHVECQQRSGVTSILTVLALVRLLSSVRAFVRFQIARVGKRLITHVAFMRSFSCVRFRVFIQNAFDFRRKLALTALESPLGWVSLRVWRKLVLLIRCERTVGTAEFDWIVRINSRFRNIIKTHVYPR